MLIVMVGCGGSSASPIVGGNAAELKFSSTSLNFGNIVVGQTAPVQSLLLTNRGLAALPISGLALSDFTDYALSNACGATIPSSSQCAISLSFAPQTATALSATLTLDIAGTAQGIALSGTGTPAPVAVATLSVGSLTFSPINVGLSSAPQAFSLTNNGNTPLTGIALSISGVGRTQFVETSACPPSLAVGASCNTSVVFTPGPAPSTPTASLLVTDSAGSSPQVVSLAGTGIAALAPSASLSASSLVFGSLTVGVSSTAQTVTLTNTGTAPLTGISISLGGSSAAQFAETSTCASSLAVTASCTISVLFQPTASGTDTASLLIADNSGALPGTVQTIVLSGMATALPPYHAYGDSITFGASLLDSSKAYPDLIALDRGDSLSKYAISGSMACDIPTMQIFSNRDNPVAGAFPLYTLMIGTNDGAFKGVGAYEAVFNLCNQASLAWLALPADLKVLATDPNVTSAGPGTLETANNWNSWQTEEAGASVTFPITLSAPGPVYLWPRIVDGDSGTFTYAVDGVIVSHFTTATVPAMQTVLASKDSLAFIRISSLPAGPHKITFTQTSASGTMRIVAIGAPPSAPRSLPTLAVGNVPTQEIGGGAVCDINPSICNAYSADIEANISLFVGDGLDVRFAENHAFMHGTTPEMADYVHPNDLGQSELRYAFEAVLP